MPSTKIPKEIQEFVARFLPSIEHLETFILLQRNTVRSWSPSEIAAELGVDATRAEDVLEQLASANFLDVKISNDILYRFNPASQAMETLSARCADLYLRERIAMTNLVTTGTLSPIHDFAEAFRFRKSRRRG